MKKMFILVFFIALVALVVEMFLTLAGWYYPDKFDIFVVYSLAITGSVKMIIDELGDERMTKTYKVHYTDWKGRTKIVYIYANNLEEAKKSAEIIQGLEKLEGVEEE